VMAGLGLAFLSLHTATEELNQGRLVVLAAPGLPLVRQWFLVHPLHVPLSPAARIVQARILELEGSYLP
jgi:DNA-binding transcriptional LysR family regulator